MFLRPKHSIMPKTEYLSYYILDLCNEKCVIITIHILFQLLLRRPFNYIMAIMKRKISFYKLILEKTEFVNGTNSIKTTTLDHEKMVKHFEKIYAKTQKLENGNRAALVNTSSEVYVIEFVEYSRNHYLFMKVGRQNPAETVALRDINTLETQLVPMSQTQMLELFTYCLLDFDTGIISYIGLNGAPRISAIREFFNENEQRDGWVSAKIAVIMTQDIIKAILHKQVISKLELTVSVPDDDILSDKLGLSEKDFDLLQNVRTKTISYSITAKRNRTVFKSNSELAILIANLKGKFGDRLKKLSVKAKNPEENSEVYNLLSYSFTKSVLIENSTAQKIDTNGFKNILFDAYDSNKEELLKYSRM